MIDNIVFEGKRFSTILNSYEDNDWVTLHPVYSDNTAIVSKKDKSEWYYRKSLNGELDFLKSDFEWVLDTGGHYATLPNYVRYDVRLKEGSSVILNLSFNFTDCKVDVDNRRITVTPETKDDYTEILAGIDEEFNLIELGAEKKQMTYKKRPLIEILPMGGYTHGIAYQRGQPYITDIDTRKVVQTLEGIGSLRHDYCFWPVAGYKVVTISGEFTAANGVYFGSANDLQNYSYDLYNINGDTTYKVRVLHNAGQTAYGRISIIRTSDSAVLYELQGSLSTNDLFDILPQTQFYGYALKIYAEMITPRFFARLLCDTLTVAGQPTYAKPIEDVTYSGGNYSRIIPLNMSNLVSATFAKSSNITNYLYNNNIYYQLPTNDYDRWHPIALDEWGNMSMWLNKWACDYSEPTAEKITLINDTYKVSSIISKLLEKIGSSVTHAPTTIYSQFLYGTNPISNKDFRLLITQKTNIKVSSYDTAATKAPIRLSDILTMLKNVFNCYWFIDDQHRLRIEHLSWFLKGGTYSSSSVLTTYKDLTAIYNARNGKKWAFNTNNFSFNKSEISQTKEFCYMDNTNEIFDGQKIEVTAPFVQKGKIDTINAGNFTANIDYVLQRPDLISDDGYMLFAPVVQNLHEALPYVLTCENIAEGAFDAPIYVQNPYLAYSVLERVYFLYNLAGSSVKIGNKTYQVQIGTREKTNEAVVPDCALNLNPYQMIKTLAGDGLISEISVNLQSKIGKAKLNYATE